MTLEDLLREVGEFSVRSARLQSDIVGYINRAQKAIAERRDWTFMHDRRAIVIANGTTGAPLGETFKKLGNEPSPISFTYGLYNLPVIVTSRARIEATGVYPYLTGPTSTPIPGSSAPVQVVFLEQNGGQWELNIPSQYSINQDVSFNVSAFWYPTPLRKGDDHNPMTDHGDLSEALVNLAKSLAFRAEAPDDPRGKEAKLIAEEVIVRALYTDTAKQFQGRVLRM